MQGRAVNPRTPEYFGVLNTQTQNCSGVGPKEISTPEHNFSTPEQKSAVFLALKIWNNNILIMKSAILAMETSTL